MELGKRKVQEAKEELKAKIIHIGAKIPNTF
jgi:hypothetical protein